MLKHWVGIFCCCLLLSSCFDVKEELIVSPKGSGVYQLTVDFSATINAYAVNKDSTEQIQKLKNLFLDEVVLLKAQTDIHNINFTTLANDRIYRIGFEFNNIAALNRAINSSTENRVTLEEGKLLLKGGLPELANLRSWQKEPDPEDVKLKTGPFRKFDYAMVVSVPGNIKKCSNKLAKKTTGSQLEMRCSMAKMIEKKKTNAMTIKYK